MLHQSASLSTLQPKYRLYFFIKKDKFIDPESKKIRVHEVSKYLIGGIVAVSWIFIMRWWYTAEDRAFVKAEQYLEEKRKRGEDVGDISATQMLDEEYRSEYIEKTKRKYQRLIKEKAEEEQKQRRRLTLQLEQQQMGLQVKQQEDQ